MPVEGSDRLSGAGAPEQFVVHPGMANIRHREIIGSAMIGAHLAVAVVGFMALLMWGDDAAMTVAQSAFIPFLILDGGILLSSATRRALR